MNRGPPSWALTRLPVLVFAPIAGAVEWCSAPGRRVEAGAALGWIAGPGRCGLVALSAPEAGVVTWRREGVLAAIEVGEPGVVLGDDPAARAQAQQAQRVALRAALAQVDEELAALDAGGASPLSAALLGPQRTDAARRRERLQALLLEE